MGTFIELLIGAMPAPTGFITEVYLVVAMRNHWISYYKWLQKGRWSRSGLSRQLVRLTLKGAKQDMIHLVINPATKYVTLSASNRARIGVAYMDVGQGCEQERKLCGF